MTTYTVFFKGAQAPRPFIKRGLTLEAAGREMLRSNGYESLFQLDWDFKRSLRLYLRFAEGNSLGVLATSSVPTKFVGATEAEIWEKLVASPVHFLEAMPDDAFDAWIAKEIADAERVLLGSEYVPARDYDRQAKRIAELEEKLEAAARILHKASEQFTADGKQDWAQRCLNAHDAALGTSGEHA